MEVEIQLWKQRQCIYKSHWNLLKGWLWLLLECARKHHPNRQSEVPTLLTSPTKHMRFRTWQQHLSWPCIHYSLIGLHYRYILNGAVVRRCSSAFYYLTGTQEKGSGEMAKPWIVCISWVYPCWFPSSLLFWGIWEHFELYSVSRDRWYQL